MKIQLRKCGPLYHIQGHPQLEHNHDLLSPKHPDITDDLEAIVKDLLKVGMPRTRILDFLVLRTGRIFSWFQLAELDSEDIRRAIGTDTDRLLEYMCTRGDCWLFEVPVDDEMKRAAILTITAEERENLGLFGDVVFLDGTAVRNPLGWTTYPMTLVDDAKGIVSGGLLFTAYEREEMFT
jgi:hypothetical protein